MDNYFKFCLLLGIICHQHDQLRCESQINDGLRQDYCGASLYQCKNGVCIRKSQVCDRNRDCHEGDDEEGCIFADDHSTFCAKADNRCSCDIFFGLLELSCIETGLVSFPRFINKEKMNVITLKGNKIPKLTPEMFKDVGTLYKLVLERNEIVSIENEAFIGLGYFSDDTSIAPLSIDLTDNYITQLTSRMFEHLGRLSLLSLKRNQISNIENEAFSNLTIQHLDLSGNKLTKLTPGMFNGVKKISTLDISQNEISTIEDYTFYSLDDMEFYDRYDWNYLNISGNRITKLTPGMFKGLDRINELYLQDNEIDTIENNAFSVFHRLYTLDLRRNKSSTLRKGMLNSPKDLSRNKLTEIKAHTFEYQAPLVMQLNLSNNEISRIESHTFEKLHNLLCLDLSKNPIHNVDKDIFNNTSLDTLLVDDTRICCSTNRTKCNYRTSETYFCEEHTTDTSNTGWYIGAGIFLIIIITTVAIVFKFNVCNAKRLCSR